MPVQEQYQIFLLVFVDVSLQMQIGRRFYLFENGSILN